MERSVRQPFEIALPILLVAFSGLSFCVALVCLSIRTIVSTKSVTVELFPFRFVIVRIDRAQIDSFHLKRVDKMEVDNRNRLNGNGITLRRLSINVSKGSYALCIKTKAGEEVFVRTRHPSRLIKSVWSMI
jgi:hypothetical protein